MKLPTLIALSKNRKETSALLCILRDGWAVTRKGAMGDIGEDCEIKIAGLDIKEFRKNLGLSQQEMAWCLDISRFTYIHLEQGKRDITLKEFLMLNYISNK